MKRSILIPALILSAVLLVPVPTVVSSTVAGQAASAMQQLFVMKEMKPGVAKVGVFWDDSHSDSEELLTRIRRAATGQQVQLVLANVNDERDVAHGFRELTRTHEVDAIWIPEDFRVLSGGQARDYIVRNSATSRIPLFVPTQAWVAAGALVSVQIQSDQLTLMVNERTANALGITVPEQYSATANFIAGR